MLPPTPFYHHITKGLFTAVLFTSISHLGIKKKLQDILFISLKRQSNYQNQTWQIYWNYQTWNSNNYQKKQGNSRKTSTLLTMLKPLTVWITTNWKILKEMEILDHLTCLLRNLYAGQEATVRTRHGTTDWFKIRKGACQGCILSPCLFNSCRVHHGKCWAG